MKICRTHLLKGLLMSEKFLAYCSQIVAIGNR